MPNQRFICVQPQQAAQLNRRNDLEKRRMLGREIVRNEREFPNQNQRKIAQLGRYGADNGKETPFDDSTKIS